MPQRVLALDLTKLYSSSTDENDEKKRLEGVASYQKVDGEASNRNNNSNNNNNSNAKRAKARAKSPLKFQNHELELSCTERIARQRYPAANYQRKYPHSARDERPFDEGPSFMNIKHLQDQVPFRHEEPSQTRSRSKSPRSKSIAHPVKVLEERASRAPPTKIPALSKVDIMPALGGDALEYSDSVDDPDSLHHRRHHLKNQSIMSMMSSLSDTSAMGQEFPPFGELGELEEKSQFEVPRKQKTADAPVVRRDEEWRRREEMALNREFQDFQLVKQLAGGASIMRGVSYRRGIKGTNIAQRYQANLEKIMFIQNVYEHRDFRDTFPRETKKSVKKTQLGLNYQLQQGSPTNNNSNINNNNNHSDKDSIHGSKSIHGQFSFVHGPAEERELINANLYGGAHHHPHQHQHQQHSPRNPFSSQGPSRHQSPPSSAKPIVHVPMIMPLQHPSVHLQPSSIVDDQQLSMSTAAQQQQQYHPQFTHTGGPQNTSPAPSAAKPGHPSYRTQRLYHQQQQQQQQQQQGRSSPTSGAIATTTAAASSVSPPVHRPQHQHHPQHLAYPETHLLGTESPTQAAIVASHASSSSSLQGGAGVGVGVGGGGGGGGIEGSASVSSMVPKASDLLPEALSLDPTVHLDVGAHLVRQRSPQYKLDDGRASAGAATTAMLMMTGLVQHQQLQHHLQQQQQQQQQQQLQQQQHQSPRRHASPSAALSTVGGAYVRPMSSRDGHHSIMGSSGVGGVTMTDATTSLSVMSGLVPPGSLRSSLLGHHVPPVAAAAVAGVFPVATSSVEVATAAFAHSIQHHHAFMSSQMRRVKHDSMRQQYRAQLVFDDLRLQDTLGGKPMTPPPRTHAKTAEAVASTRAAVAVANASTELADLVSTGHQLAMVAHDVVAPTAHVHTHVNAHAHAHAHAPSQTHQVPSHRSPKAKKAQQLHQHQQQHQPQQPQQQPQQSQQSKQKSPRRSTSPQHRSDGTAGAASAAATAANAASGADGAPDVDDAANSVQLSLLSAPSTGPVTSKGPATRVVRVLTDEDDGDGDMTPVPPVQPLAKHSHSDGDDGGDDGGDAEGDDEAVAPLFGSDDGDGGDGAYPTAEVDDSRTMWETSDRDAGSADDGGNGYDAVAYADGDADADADAGVDADADADADDGNLDADEDSSDGR